MCRVDPSLKRADPVWCVCHTPCVSCGVCSPRFCAPNHSTVLFSFIVVATTVPVSKRAVRTLMNVVPPEINLVELHEDLLQIDVRGACALCSTTQAC